MLQGFKKAFKMKHRAIAQKPNFHKINKNSKIHKLFYKIVVSKTICPKIVCRFSPSCRGLLIATGRRLRRLLTAPRRGRRAEAAIGQDWGRRAEAGRRIFFSRKRNVGVSESAALYKNEAKGPCQ